MAGLKWYNHNGDQQLMALAFVDVNLAGGADVPGADDLYTGFGTLNTNFDNLASNAAVGSSGASGVGYFGGTNVQDALDGMSATSSVTNVGAGEGDVYRDITTGTINLRTIKQGSNITVTTTGDIITISSNLANAANLTVLDYTTHHPYTTLSDDETIIVNTEDTAFTINLQAGTDKRVFTIKNRAWDGTGASPTQNTTEVTITPDTGEYIEDDRTGLPAVSTAIGPGSAMKIVFDANESVWSII